MSSKPTKKNILPGLGLTLSYTLLYLSLIVVIPLSPVVLKTVTLTWGGFLEAVVAPRVLGASLLILLFGVAAAWAIAKFDFRGKSLLSERTNLS